MFTLFLDIDGVLNHAEMLPQFKRYPERVRSMITMLDPVAIQRLNRILYELGPRVVLSSSWRHYDTLWDIQTALEHHGFYGKLVDKTGPDKGAHRGQEVLNYVMKHAIQRYLVLDDAKPLEGMEDRWVHTSWAKGLQDEHIAEALEKARNQK